MQSLHAHWRMEYVQEPQEKKSGRSPFRTALEDPDPRRSLVLYRAEHAFILMNRYPYNAGHLLVLPCREVADFSDMMSREVEQFFQLILKAKDVLERGLRPDGFNIGFNLGSAAGAGLPQHLHCHVVPRWSGDTNFMPVIGQTKVLNQALETLYDHLCQFV